MTTISRGVTRLVPNRTFAVVGVLVLAGEILAASSYLVITGANTSLSTLAYPFIWINVGLWAVVTTTPGPTDRRHRLIARGVGALYFLALAVAGGVVWVSPAFSDPSVPTGIRVAVASVPPGWGPAVLYVGEVVSVSLIPFELVGYVALAYLVYTTVIDAVGSAITGVVGLFSCVSCVWPILGTVVTSVFGSGSALATVATNQPYGVSTVVFVSAVALLYWRPLR